MAEPRAAARRAPQDADGHGTHCAGTVGAVANNALGVAGVAGGVRLLGCKAIAGLDGHLVTSAAVRCLEYCAAAGAHITSNSWGGQARGARSEVPLYAACEACAPAAGITLKSWGGRRTAPAAWPGWRVSLTA